MAKTMVIDMTHFLENGMIPEDIPTPARRLASVGLIVTSPHRMLFLMPLHRPACRRPVRT